MKREVVFLDANVLFSVAYGSVGLSHLWALSRKGICTLVASRYVIEEARRNLDNKDKLDRLEKCVLSVKVVHETDPDLSCPIDLPEKDAPVLMAAISAGADYLLTGDVKHFGVYFGKSIMGVQILMPRDYLLPRI